MSPFDVVLEGLYMQGQFVQLQMQLRVLYSTCKKGFILTSLGALIGTHTQTPEGQAVRKQILCGKMLCSFRIALYASYHTALHFLYPRMPATRENCDKGERIGALGL
jgi:hypothetical protein